MMLGSTKFYQFADTFPRSAPLLPIAHANTTTQPMIHFNGIVILQGDTEVIHPSMKIGTDFSVPASHRDTPTAASKSAQFGLETFGGFLRDGEPLSGEGETEETTLLRLHHLALVPVDLHLEFPLKVSADTFHHTLSGTL